MSETLANKHRGNVVRQRDDAGTHTWRDRTVPDEGDLVLVHPGLQLQAGILSKRRDNETEDERDADEHSRKDDLQDSFTAHTDEQ